MGDEQPSRMRVGSSYALKPIAHHPLPITHQPEDPMRYWLMKSEPDEFSIDDLARAPKKSTAWFGVRNYLAGSSMRGQMQLGDRVLFYHSSCEGPGIAGIAEVGKLAYPDETQFDKKSKYY